MNKIAIIGNLTADPEMRTTTSGVSMCNFSVAVNRRHKSEDGKQQVDYIPVVVWRQLAELCGKYLTKGRKVGIVGSLQSRSYEDKNGNKRTGYQVNADEVEFLTPKGNQGGEENAPQSDFDGFNDDDMNLPF